VDTAGRAVFAYEDRVVKGTLAAGIDASFGAGGHAPAPNAGFTGQSWPSAVALLPSGGAVVVQAAHTTSRDTTARFYDGAGNMQGDVHGVLGAQLDTTDPTVFVQVATDGAVYVAGTRLHPPDPASAGSTPAPGADAVVVRLRNGAIDTTFGDQGTASALFAAAWPNAATGPVTATPAAFAVDAMGRPWIAVSAGSAGSGPDLALVRRGAALARFLP
jgi:hypothetical protein